MGESGGPMPCPDPWCECACHSRIPGQLLEQGPREGSAATVTRSVWAEFNRARRGLKAATDRKRAAEIRLRQQIGDCADIMVAGQRVAYRVRWPMRVKPYTRTMDVIRRVKTTEDKGNE